MPYPWAPIRLTAALDGFGLVGSEDFTHAAFAQARDQAVGTDGYTNLGVGSDPSGLWAEIRKGLVVLFCIHGQGLIVGHQGLLGKRLHRRNGFQIIIVPNILDPGIRQKIRCSGSFQE